MRYDDDAAGGRFGGDLLDDVAAERGVAARDDGDGDRVALLGDRSFYLAVAIAGDWGSLDCTQDGTGTALAGEAGAAGAM